MSLSLTHTLNKLNHVICKPTWGREVSAFRTAEYPLNEFLIFFYIQDPEHCLLSEMMSWILIGLSIFSTAVCICCFIACCLRKVVSAFCSLAHGFCPGPIRFMIFEPIRYMIVRCRGSDMLTDVQSACRN